MLPQLQQRRIQDQHAAVYNVHARYGNGTDTDVRSCLNQMPQVPCQSDLDCARWMAENCNDQDRRSTVGVCQVGNTCAYFQQ